MRQLWQQVLTLAGIALAGSMLTACHVTSDRDDSTHAGGVNIQTPMGGLTAKADPWGGATGLPIYPGARPVTDDDKHDSGQVDIDSPFFTLKVASATFDVEAAPDTVLMFYRNALSAYGPVTECRGEVKFRQRRGIERATCRERGGWDDRVQLAVGPENAAHLTTVEPHGRGTRFTVVAVNTRQRF